MQLTTYNYIKNPDKEMYDLASKAVQENEGYCPCALEHIDETKCMCKDFQEQQTNGFCHCQRYYKIKKPPVYVLVGSSQFKDQFFEVAHQLTLDGNLVWMPNYFGHVDNDPRFADKASLLDDLSFSRIAFCDVLYVINVGGYIGESTRLEIERAIALQKEIVYLEETKG